MLCIDLLELYRCNRSTSSLDFPLLLAAFTTNNFAGPENEEESRWQTTTMCLLDVFKQTTPACTASYLRYRVRTNKQRCCDTTKPPSLNFKQPDNENRLRQFILPTQARNYSQCRTPFSKHITHVDFITQQTIISESCH